MAISEQLSILRTGRKVWNAWRDDNQDLRPDLSGVDLTDEAKEYEEFNFSKTSLAGARLTMRSFINCDFTESDLTGISAQGSYWRNANLVRAKISGDLVLSHFYIADLTGAQVRGTGLIDAELRYIRLNHSEFSAYLGETHINSWTILDSDLSGLMNASRGFHEFPCNVDISTLQRTAKGINADARRATELASFFEGCGLPNEIITVFLGWAGGTSLRSDSPSGRNYFSCFISYSHADKMFVKQLHDELVSRGVQCWLDDHEISPGADIFDEIDRGIRKWDKVLLVCSNSSLASPWVDRELEKAFQKEEDLWRERGSRVPVVIPLDLDGQIWQWQSGKASAIKSRYIPDFSRTLDDPDAFRRQVEGLFRALDADLASKRSAPMPKI